MPGPNPLRFGLREHARPPGGSYRRGEYQTNFCGPGCNSVGVTTYGGVGHLRRQDRRAVGRHARRRDATSLLLCKLRLAQSRNVQPLRPRIHAGTSTRANTRSCTSPRPRPAGTTLRPQVIRRRGAQRQLVLSLLRRTLIVGEPQPTRPRSRIYLVRSKSKWAKRSWCRGAGTV